MCTIEKDLNLWSSSFAKSVIREFIEHEPIVVSWRGGVFRTNELQALFPSGTGYIEDIPLTGRLEAREILNSCKPSVDEALMTFKNWIILAGLEDEYDIKEVSKDIITYSGPKENKGNILIWLEGLSFAYHKVFKIYKKSISLPQSQTIE